MFVLFDMVIHKPSHPDTETNLALLDTLAGYFGRFDYATGGSIPCRLFAGFAHIANDFVRDQWQSTTMAAEEPAMQNTAQGTQGINFASRCTYSPDSYFAQSVKSDCLEHYADYLDGLICRRYSE